MNANGHTDGWTDGRTDRPSHSDARTQWKKKEKSGNSEAPRIFRRKRGEGEIEMKRKKIGRKKKKMNKEKGGGKRKKKKMYLSGVRNH